MKYKAKCDVMNWYDGDEDYYVMERRNYRKIFIWVVFGVIAAITIYLPFYGQTLRYQTSIYFSKIFSTVGTILVFFGGLMIVWGFISILCTKSLGALKLLIMGLMVVYIGSWFLGPTTGVGPGAEEAPMGYY